MTPAALTPFETTDIRSLIDEQAARRGSIRSWCGSL